MNKLTSTLAGLALAATLCVSALAGTTQIAQVPLLNITGTGTVKPNLMLLFDNSGSMDQTYTPDYVNDNLCRSAATLQAGITACAVGHPPFMSPDFNKQYYNPAIRYLVPIKSDGSYYPEQNAANTTNWTSVSGDGFGAHKADMAGNTVSTNINLVTGFPDLKWCSGSTCQFNTASYTYPDATYQTATAITTGPYYYTIGVGQFCTDDSMKTCVSTAVGATAPPGYPVPAKVRWCSDKLLTQCQGKRVGSFIYPGYSKPAGATASYGTIAIGASATASSLGITSVVVNGSTTVTNATVTAATGTNSLIKQQGLASALAANIIATSVGKGAASTSLYYACVKTPTGQPTVPACSVFGITLSSDNLVAVVPVSCTSSVAVANCVTVADSSRAGWGIAVNAPTVAVTAYAPARAVVSFNGTGSTTSSSQTAILKNLSYAGTVLVGGTSSSSPTYLSLGKGQTPTQIAAALVAKIGTSNTIKAYLGNSSNCPSGYTVTSVCLVNTASTDNTATISTFTMDNQGSVSWTTTGSSGYVAAVNDTIPTTTTALTAGSGAPNPFVRVNIVSGQAYPKASDRTDCAGTTCTYAEEMNNFANWYVYYKSRLQMMKTSIGIAFAAITANYKVGYVKLSSAGASAAIDLKPADFTGSARASWYTTLYNTTTSGSTPIRTAMDNVGRMFANLTPYNYAAGQEVVQYPCQQNFMILTTDGYWNGTSTANVVNNDNVENASRFCTQARGCVDARAQTQPSISDVALHWYNGGSSTTTVSLRPALEPDMSKPGSVPAGGGENTHLHMNTYTLGLGVDGVMTYEPNYDTAPKTGGDFYNLITAATSGCPWNGGGAYVWPDPDVTNTASTVQERVDDLWHAAINGHGKYFSAQDPKDVVGGLSEALSNMQVHVGAAAAAATSTPNITLTDNDIFSDTFTTVKWYGELSDRKIDSTDGSVLAASTWTTSDTLGKKVGNSSDTRTIYMYNTGGALASAPDPFLFANMKGPAASWFANRCTSLAQCVLLSASDKALVNDGNNLVNYLRGQQQYADDNLFRAYTLTLNTPAGAAGPIPIVLGDIASSKPAFVRDPRNDYPDPDYATFKDTYGNPSSAKYRSGTVFTAANDGMLHAFDSATGGELWAYVPRITMKKLYALAGTTYGTNHQFTTDGSPEVADVKASVGWRTVLVAGLNGGGRGYYALDITDTSHPKQLWEFCADATVCPLSDGDLGLTFGNPQFGTLANGRWAVFLTSGYNNVPGTDGVGTGTGKGFLYVLDAYTGELISKISNNAGDTTTPSGLAKISAISDDPGADPRIQYIYGGDNQGQMWRFDLSASSGAITVTMLGNAGTSKPITTRPDVTMCAVQVTTSVGGVPVTTTSGKRVVLFGTGRLLDVPDTSDTSVQSLYLLKDSATPIADIRGSTMVKQTLSLLGSSSNTNTYQVTSNPVDLTQKDGWYFDWSVNAGERMNLDPQIVSGVANVVTNMPSSSSACSVGGSSNLYQVNVCNGQAIGGHPVGATLSNTSAAVGFIIIRLPNGQLKMITTLADGTNKTSPLSEQISADAHRTGWRRVKGE
ncbi:MULTISPECIES: pilus assembly protein [unclassified Duganella]|uniref:pilus assembly protein n=1 Tax=unclassified Duganella TaxID=2636909 RepID=UPI000E346866|nr:MULTISPECIES: PilC/PilY family type IV pilus protein [unclassified Duganella]RFP19035.1 hypothetical protein D0T23_04425 [Duganella sp. BJB475]RFP35697.1 hypothetical protein D0T21_04425 [Duganella sp. BJB476]